MKRKGEFIMKKTRLLALLLALVLTCGLAACAAGRASAPAASQSFDSNASSNYKSETASDSAPMEEPMASEESWDSAFSTESYDGASETTDAAEDVPAESLADKMIYSANLDIQTTEYDAAVAALEASVTDFGGFVEQSNTYGDIRYNDDGTSRVVNRIADYTVRIPAERFREFLAQAGGLGNVLSCNRYAENVTPQYTDYEARLSSLNTQEERLLSMLEKAEDVESLIALEERLADVRYEIESIERNLRNLDRRIAYSSVTISLREVEIYTPTKAVQRTFGEKLHDALTDGWSSFTRGFQYFLIDLVYALPGLILFLLIAGAAVFAAVKVVRKRRAKKAAAKAAAEQPPEEK